MCDGLQISVPVIKVSILYGVIISDLCTLISIVYEYELDLANTMDKFMIIMVFLF